MKLYNPAKSPDVHNPHGNFSWHLRLHSYVQSPHNLLGIKVARSNGTSNISGSSCRNCSYIITTSCRSQYPTVGWRSQTPRTSQGFRHLIHGVFTSLNAKIKR